MSRVAAPATWVLGMLVIACAAPEPTQPGPEVHFVNLIGNTVVVANISNEIVGSSGPGPRYVLRPCGGEVTAPAVDLTTSDGRLLIYVMIDPSGLLDDAVANWSGDLRDMGGSFSMDAIWSRGNISIDELPKWIVVRPEGVEIASAEPLATTPPSCAPWPEVFE